MLSVILLLSCAQPAFAADETISSNDFVGVINIYTSADPQHTQWNAVLHDEELIMMTPEDIAEIAGLSRMDYNRADNAYDFSRGSYRVHVDVDTRTAKIYVDVTSSGSITPYDSFRLDYIGTAVLDGEECTILPLEQMLYLLNVQWQCRNDCVYTFAPKETLWNIMGDYVQMAQCLPKKTDLIGTTAGDILSNSFMFAMMSFGDEVSLTTVVPQMGFMSEKTKQALLTLSVPCENITGDLSGKAEQMLGAYVSAVADAAGAVGTAGDILETASTGFELFSNGFAKLDALGNTAAMEKVTDGGAVVASSLSTVADLVDVSVSMARTLTWTETYLKQIDYLTSVNDSSCWGYCLGLNNQATIIATESAEPFAMAAAEGAVAVGKNTADFLINGTVVGLAFSSYNFGVIILSTLPEVQTALNAGDEAYYAVELCDLAILMRSKYVKAMDDTSLGVTQEYLDNVRLTGSLLMNASAHAFDKMHSVEKSMNKDTSAIDYKLLYANTAALRFEESAMYDAIIIDNCQDILFGGFAPNSESADILSKALGNRTVLSGSISRGKNDPSQSLQMMSRPLMSPDELKTLPKGNFILAKTGCCPMQTRLPLFLKWGIRFGDAYEVEEQAARPVVYADRFELEQEILRRRDDFDEDELDEPPMPPMDGSRSAGQLHTPAPEPQEQRSQHRPPLRTD